MEQFSLSKLIYPLSFADFFAGYWEQKYLHLQHGPGYFDDVLSVTGVDGYLSRQDLSPEAIKVVKNGDRIPEIEWTHAAKAIDGAVASIVNNANLYQQYNTGATIIINAAQRSIPSLAHACRLFEQELNISVQANIYITPPNAHGFSLHYDPHDIFLLQVKGPKHWKIYNPGEELPTQYLPLKKAPQLVAEIEINSGDFLYLPRGTPHEAFSADVATIHVNFSCKPRYGFHLLQDLALLAEKDDVFFRRTIPTGLSPTGDFNSYIQLFGQKILELIAKFPPEKLIENQKLNFAQTQSVDFNGQLVNILMLEKLSVNSVVVRRPGFKYVIERSDGQCKISFGKKTLNIPTFINPDFFFTDKPFKIIDISGLATNKGKLALVREFIEAGFLGIEAI